jgi:small subunit ribosomal protein S17
MMAEETESKKPKKKEPKKGLPQLDGLIPRGDILTGRVVSDKMKKTVIVSRDITKYFPKYKKYARARSRIVAHNPSSINAKVGDMVTIAETRKLSKTKAWMVVEIIEKGGE